MKTFMKFSIRKKNNKTTIRLRLGNVAFSMEFPSKRLRPTIVG